MRDFDQRQGAVAIQDRSDTGLEHERPSVGVDESIAHAALHVLVSIMAALPAGLGGLDTLAVEHSRRRARRAGLFILDRGLAGDD